MQDKLISIQNFDPLQLCQLAMEARQSAYAPYSGFTVGAALLCDDGKIYLGANLENSSFSPTVCAERTAFCKAIFDKERSFTAIAIAGGKAGEKAEKACPPCGVCRQVMAEFCNGDFMVYLAHGDTYDDYPLKALLPCSFLLEEKQ